MHGTPRRLFIMTLFLAASTSHAGQVRYVDAGAAGPTFDGGTWCGAFVELQDAIAVALPGDEIRVAGGTYKPDRGGGQTPGSRLATFQLKNGVTILGGHAGCGAADPGARDFTAFETILSGDLAGDDGPVFANNSENSYHVVTYGDGQATGVVLDGFTVTAGRADGTGPAGTITNQGSAVHIRNDNFKCVPGGPTLRNCTFRDNWAAHHGAVNDHAFSTVIEDCIFRDNYSGEEGAGLLIHSGSATVINTTFLNNHCDSQGGGAWISHDTDPSCNGDPSRPTFIGCTFVGNFAAVGGGIFSEKGSSPEFQGCSFTGNTAGSWGGGLWLGMGSARLTDCAFQGNEAENYGAAIYVNSGATLELERCSVTDHVARLYGGGVFAIDSTIIATDGTFENNRTEQYQGGAFYLLRSPGTFTRCTFRDNEAYFGSGISYEGDDEELTITDCVFRDNFARAGGAGISTLGGLPRVTNSVFENNLGGHGTAVVTADSDSIFEGCDFTGNIADFAFAGAMHNDGGRLQLIDCNFSGNRASPYVAGAVFNENIEVSFTNCTFHDNQSGWQGGAVYNSASTVLFSGCTFSRNTSGVAFNSIWNNVASTVRYDGCHFIREPGYGRSGIYHDDSTSALFTNCVLSENAGCNEGGQLVVLNSILRSDGGPGAGSLGTNNCQATVINSVFSGNIATGGSAITVGAGSGPLTLINSTFSANQFSAVQLMLNRSAVIRNCLFWGTPAGTEASHFSLAAGATLDIQHSCVQGWTGNFGGAGNFGADPMFIDADGLDNVFGTADDDLRLSDGSPALDAGDETWLPADFADLDNDGNTTELLPLDILGQARVSGQDVNIGAYEATVLVCQPGTVSANGEEPCTPCSPGTHQPMAGQTQCLPCDAGTFAASQGTANCPACLAGTHQPMAGQSSCLDCSCDDQNGCTTDDCHAVTGACENQEVCTIPAVSQWGVVVLALLAGIAGSLIVARRGVPGRIA